VDARGSTEVLALMVNMRRGLEGPSSSSTRILRTPAAVKPSHPGSLPKQRLQKMDSVTRTPPPMTMTMAEDGRLPQSARFPARPPQPKKARRVSEGVAKPSSNRY
jgi:hypothetical protein